MKKSTSKIKVPKDSAYYDLSLEDQHRFDVLYPVFLLEIQKLSRLNGWQIKKKNLLAHNLVLLSIWTRE